MLCRDFSGLDRSDPGPIYLLSRGKVKRQALLLQRLSESCGFEGSVASGLSSVPVDKLLVKNCYDKKQVRMKAWIFQGKPERYPLAEKLIEGERETWLVSRFKDEIRKGDIVLFWSSGSQAVRGLYGWGEVTQDSVQYFDDWGYGIEVLYKVKFDNHIGVNQVRSSGTLDGNVLLTMPIGTNFKLSLQEYRGLCSLIKSLGETPPPIPHEEQGNG